MNASQFLVGLAQYTQTPLLQSASSLFCLVWICARCQKTDFPSNIGWFVRLLFYHKTFMPQRLKKHCKNEGRIQSDLNPFSKCPKSGWNRWNMLNMIHIYVKQCEIMQKKSMKTLKRQYSLFFHCEISSMVLKTRKIRKTRQTKTRITQNFHILYPIQGGTMWKLTSQGFRKCGTFWV